jgi:hypothetical protein
VTGRAALAVGVAVAALGVTAASAGAAPPFIGEPWPGGIVRYHDTTGPNIRPLVAEAARQWNRSGAAVRFVRVPAGRADIVVRGRVVPPGVPLLGPAGTAPVGRTRSGVVTLSLPAAQPRAAQAVVVHEFGHVLGLGHQDGRRVTCSLMWPVLTLAGCPTTRDIEKERCTFVMTGDLRVVISRYGRRPPPRSRPPAFCLRGTRPPAPVAPRDLRALATRVGPAEARVVLLWSRWDRPRTQTDRVRRYTGTCAQRAQGSGVEVDHALGGRGLLVDERALPAGDAFCYEIVSITRNAEGVRSTRFGIPPAVTVIDVPVVDKAEADE